MNLYSNWILPVKAFAVRGSVDRCGRYSHYCASARLHGEYFIASVITKSIRAFLRGKPASLQIAPTVDISISRLQKEDDGGLWHP